MSESTWYCPVCQIEGSEPGRLYCPEDGARLCPIGERGALWIGQVLADKYRIVRFIDAGGMAEVYEAERLGTGKRVAVKLLHASLAEKEGAIERFLAEARMVSLIAHPNVVAIQDFGTLPGAVHYMVMELLEGEPLSAALARGPIRPLHALTIAMQACEGLAAAHERNVIHCDVKPANLFLQRSPQGDPVVKILDLGIGRLCACGGGGLDEPGGVSGTPNYMSPEQALARSLSPASDIYSMGVVLYEMLLGRLPFDGPSHIVVLTRHAMEPPEWPADLAALRGVPPEAGPVVLRALSKAPEERQESMMDLQRELAAVATRLRAVAQASRAPTQEIPVARRTLPFRPDHAPSSMPPARSTPPESRARGITRVPLASATGADDEVVEVAPDVYWVGRRHGQALECNAYLRVFRRGTIEVSVLVDPGPPRDLDMVSAKVSAVIGSMRRLDYVFLNHQDPDVASNAAAIQQASPRARVLCSVDTFRLAQFYGFDQSRFTAVEDFPQGRTTVATGHEIVFVPTPFCHFRGAVMLFDPQSRVLFSGDLYGGAHTAGLVADDRSWAGVVQFHQIYMPSRRALQRAAEAVHRLDPAPAIIAPQHGALVVGEGVPAIVDAVAGLQVGVELLDSIHDSAPACLAAANELLRELADTEGSEAASALLAGNSADPSFTRVLVTAGSEGIAGFKTDPRLALEALAAAALAMLPAARRGDLKRSIQLIWRAHGLAPRSSGPPSPRGGKPGA